MVRSPEGAQRTPGEPVPGLRCAPSGLRPELLLHTRIEARHVDDDPLVRAVADRLCVVARRDPERERAAVDRNQLGGGVHPPAASAAASITLIMTGVASTGTSPLPMLGAVCSTPTSSSADPVRPGFN